MSTAARSIRLKLQPRVSVALRKRLAVRRAEMDKFKMRPRTGFRDCEWDCVWFVHGSTCCEARQSRYKTEEPA